MAGSRYATAVLHQRVDRVRHFGSDRGDAWGSFAGNGDVLALLRRDTVSLCRDLVRYAAYALLCGVVYVVGFPLGILVLLYRRRHKLFGSDADPFVATTRAKYGFLYQVQSLLLQTNGGSFALGELRLVILAR